MHKRSIVAIWALTFAITACSRNPRDVVVFESVKRESHVLILRRDQFPDRDSLLVQLSHHGRIMHGPAYLGPDIGDIELSDVGNDEIMAIAVQGSPRKIVVAFDTNTKDFWFGSQEEAKPRLMEKLRKSIGEIDFVEFSGQLR